MIIQPTFDSLWPVAVSAAAGDGFAMWKYAVPWLMLVVPLVLFALLIHWFEKTIQKRLSSRFGWNSVLLTGWLGTPIHESSHAIMCLLFRHRIDEISYFEPDRQSGRLGYVRHSFHEGNWFEELGNPFIAIAPLLGGSLGLLLLLAIFYPHAADAAFGNSLGPSGRIVATDHDESAGMGALSGLANQTLDMGRELVAVEHWTTFRFWLFLYLVLCVASHMAPSRSDYQGAAFGIWVMLAMLFGGAVVFYALGVDADAMIDLAATLLAPLFAILGLALVLCGLMTVVVTALTAFLPSKQIAVPD